MAVGVAGYLGGAESLLPCSCNLSILLHGCPWIHPSCGRIWRFPVCRWPDLAILALMNLPNTRAKDENLSGGWSGETNENLLPRAPPARTNTLQLPEHSVRPPHGAGASNTEHPWFPPSHAPRDMAAVRASPRLRSFPLLLSRPDAAAAVRRSSTSPAPTPASARAMSSPSSSSSSATPSPYTTLVGRVTCEREIKRSKFIAIASPVPNERAAMAFLDEVKDPRATHNCWAYKLGEQFRYNDDGEPSSTAGKPIYSAIISSGIDMVMVVVIRYFGGIKLGTGGLVRAYGGVASECLKDAPTHLVKPKAHVGMEVPFDLLGTVYHQLQHFQAEDIKQDYDTGKDGTVMVMFRVEYEKVEDLGNAVNSACSRKIGLFL